MKSEGRECQLESSVEVWGCVGCRVRFAMLMVIYRKWFGKRTQCDCKQSPPS